AAPEQLNAAGEPAFPQGYQRPHAFIGVGGIQVEKDDIRILRVDILGEPSAADQLDRVDADAAQRFGESLQKSEVRIDDEAERCPRPTAARRRPALCPRLGHGWTSNGWTPTGARSTCR